VLIDGHDIFKDAIAAKKNIGYLPEIPPLYLDMTVTEYLKFVAELKRVPKKRRTDEVIDVLEKTQITGVCDKLIRNLSKGYRQRVGLAQALIGNPEVIILDEPTVGLDPKQITEVRELIYSLKEDHAVILSSHILSEISEVCDHVFIISQGKLVLSDTTQNLPLHLHSAQSIDVVGQGDVEEAKKVLLALPHVANVDGEALEKQMAHLVITADSHEDIRAQVSTALASAGFAIFEMKEVGQSLEDVFLQMTADTYASEPEEENEEAEEDAEDESNI
jgi:ABC-2 type transport system ATP-binding protein